MARSRSRASAVQRSEGGSDQSSDEAKTRKSDPAYRRQLYAEDVTYRERAKANSRDYYRKDHPFRPKLRRGLLKEGVSKECWRDGIDHPVVIVAYTMRDAAEALGRTMLTFKKWVTDGIIPPPIYEDTIYGYQHYSQGELEVIADVLRQHEQEFRYVLSSHTLVIHTLWQRVEGYRHENY